MKINQDTIIRGDIVTLVPYQTRHVPCYHAWMQSTALQELTASEPLSIEAEFEMQLKWVEDDDSKH
jgi:hypothetical protein